jgi:malonyl CoA-acyl carrier protein transacylase
MTQQIRTATSRLFANINVRTLQHTFTHPKGLRFATQFAQNALVIMSRAAFEDLCSKGFVQPDAAFAGHLLGEFSTLASVADILPNSSLVDVVFYRGLTMQRASSPTSKVDRRGLAPHIHCCIRTPHLHLHRPFAHHIGLSGPHKTTQP